MKSSFFHFLDRQTVWSVYVICVVLTGMVGLLDYASGYEISFFIFYALPIWIAAWYAGKRSGLVIALASFVIWTIADFCTGHPYSHPLIPYWNGLIRLVFFVFTALAVDDMKARLRLEELNADFDALTGILNGRGFRKKADILYPLIQRSAQSYGIAFIDVDNFKQVNDTKGHAEGDLILKKVAETMADCLRTSDMISRFGGDEFVVLLPRADLEGCRKAMEVFKARLDEMAQANGWPIGFSIGVGIFDGKKTDIEAAIQAADALMYDVKRGGKGNVLCRVIAPVPVPGGGYGEGLMADLS